MKTISVRNLQKKVRYGLELSQKDHVIVTRNGQPAAVMIGVRGSDWESLALQTNASFWKMIEKRRQEKTISLSQLKKSLRI